MKTQENGTLGQVNQSTELRAVFEIDQGGKKQTLMVRKERVVIGSVESADIRLQGSKIAPIHAFLELTFGANEQSSVARLVDLASPTGVTVNGKRVVNEVLKPGDIVQIGDAIVKFKFATPEFQKTLPDQTLILIQANEIKPIFDYRPPVKESLEVVYSWNSVILNVNHFTNEQTVRLGETKRDDFLVPPIFSNGSTFELAERSGRTWTIHLDPKMSGVLYLKGELHSVDEYRRSRAGGDGQGLVTLGENDFIKLDVGGVSFYVSQTVAPPVLKNNRSVIADPFLAKSLLTSVILTAFILGGILMMEPPIEKEAPVPESVATILYHPEKYSVRHPIAPPEEKKEAVPEATPPPAKPKHAEIDFTKPEKKITKPAQTKSSQPGKKQAAESQAKEGAGARAKGEEGSRGSKNAKASNTKQNAANRPSPNAGVGRGGTESQVADNGNVQLLKGQTNKILDLLGGSGQKMANSGSKLSGFGGFSTQGNSGAALEGRGKGGGGDANTLLGGTSDHGRGGGKVGTGLGAEGTGAGIVGGKTRVELNAGGGDETVVIGSIDRDAIDAAIRAHLHEFNYCYESEINKGHPNLAGKIMTVFVIGGSGKSVATCDRLKLNGKSRRRKMRSFRIDAHSVPTTGRWGSGNDQISVRVFEREQIAGVDEGIQMENTNTIQFQDDEATFFLAEGQSYKGPFKPSEIYSMIEAKTASWVDYCYREKEGAWIRIADHPVFKAIQAEPPKPKPKVSAPPPPPKTQEQVVNWFIFQNDTQTGPYSAADVSRLLASGQIQSSAFVWQEKFTEWKPLNQVDDFKNASTPKVNGEKKSQERRVAPRKPLVAQAYLTNLKEVMTGICRDISVGGMQVLCEAIPGSVGETIRLNILPPESSGLKAFVAEGVIVRVLEDKKGFSFRFTKLNDEAKTAIERYIA